MDETDSKLQSMAHNKTMVDPTNEETSKEILKFLKEEEGKIEVGKFKDVTLVMGFTGSGKSTLTQFLTGNDEGLTAVETGEDSGEFTIHDNNHNVCRGTIDSCTIIPTLYTDKDSKTGFYDCPGFGDTRSVKHDISVTYFIKKVIDSVDSVKLLLTVNHHSLREGVDRQNFMLLVKNVLKMVKNINKFKHGIALVVTKVENSYKINKKTKMATLVPDIAVISNIAQFLENVKETLTTKQVAQPSEDPSYYSDAIKFIDILLEKDGDNYSRIGLFRRPDEEGPLTRSTLLKTNKAQIHEILQNIRYIHKTTQDFGYTVSAESLNQMHDLIHQVNKKLTMAFNHMGLFIQDHYDLQESKVKDLEKWFEELLVAHNALQSIKAGKYNSPIFLSKAIEEFVQNKNMTITTENIADVEHYDQFLGFIHEISGLPTSSSEWVNGMTEVVENVGGKKNWANLLFQLQARLLNYAVINEIWTDPNPFNSLKDCINNMENSGAETGHCEGLENFLKQAFKNKEEYAYYYSFAMEAKPNLKEWKLLKNLLNFQVEYLCSEDLAALIIMGQYVRLSDINKMDCGWSAKSVKIFALKKVFIDQSYRRIGSKTEMVIMAPNWEVIGSPEIALGGADGDDAEPQKARNGPGSGLSGYSGRAGGSGGEGGMFWGLGQNCVNCHYLSISASGGNGGAGQDGGDGAKGRDYHMQHKGDQDGKLITVVYNRVITDVIHYGEKGGDGGRGGNGGRGGPKGKAKFTLFGDGSKPVTIASQGRPGRPGAGGAPGPGGRSERRIHRVQTILVVPWWGNDDPITLPPAATGSWGVSGWSPRDTPTPTGRFSNPTQTLKDYIDLLQVKTNASLTDATIEEFLLNLERTNIDEVKHHIGRRSVDHPTDADTTNIASKKLSLTERALGFISKMTNPYKSNSLSIDTQDATNFHQLSFQGAGSRNNQILHKTQHLTSSSSEAATVGDGFGVSNLQGSLLLVDYFFRMNMRRERKKHNFYFSRIRQDSNYAQQMAYRAYVP